MLQRCSLAPAKSLTCRFTSSLAIRRIHQGFISFNATPRSHLTVRTVATSAGGEPDGSYLTLAAPHTATIEIKKSKFITTAWSATSLEEALQLVAAAKDPAASHNCFAYKIGEQSRIWDDGERRGTAGSPILTAIGGEGFDHVCVLVTRHFGGTKLGPGGLVRAYGSAARECLRAAEQRTVLPQRRLTLEVPLGDIGIAYGQVSRVAAEQLGEEYSGDGKTLRLMIRVQADHAVELERVLVDTSSGRIRALHTERQQTTPGV